MEGLQLQCFQATGTLNELYLYQLLKHCIVELDIKKHLFQV